MTDALKIAVYAVVISLALAWTAMGGTIPAPTPCPNPAQGCLK